MRAGRYEKALHHFQEALQKHSPGERQRIFEWPWLVLATQPLQRGEDLQELASLRPKAAGLSRTDLPIEEEWLEFQVVWKEAEPLLGAAHSDKTARPSAPR